MTITVERADVERFRAIVARRLGLQFENGKLDHLADVLRQRIAHAGYAQCAPYLERLAATGRWREELGPLAEQLTVGETYFFRNPDHLRAFTEVVLPDLLRARSDQRRLRILSAGCASGEEAYSLAMLVLGTPYDLGSWGVTILGIDVNPSVLAKAVQGRYSPWSLRETPSEMQARYFRADGREFVLDEGVRRMVLFEERNLLEDDPIFWQPDGFDVVFCRNVTMYFAPDVTRVVVARIAQALAPGGFLFLGHAETLRGVSQEFHLRHTHDTFYYQRRHCPQMRPAARTSGSAEPPSTSPMPTDDAWEPTTTAWFDSIRRASERIAALARGSAKRGTTSSTLEGASSASSLADAAPTSRPALGRAVELLREERFADAMAILRALPPESGTDTDAQLLRAVLLTNSGDLAEAEGVCRQLLEVDGLNAGAHYLMALCREHAGDARAAVDHNQAAAYLDPGFAMPHLHLGLVAKRAGDLESARHELEHASILLAREDSARILLFGGGFSRQALVELCRAELRACGGVA